MAYGDDSGFARPATRRPGAMPTIDLSLTGAPFMPPRPNILQVAGYQPGAEEYAASRGVIPPTASPPIPTSLDALREALGGTIPLGVPRFGGPPSSVDWTPGSGDPTQTSDLIDQLSNPPTSFPSARGGGGAPTPPMRPPGTGGSGGPPLPRQRPTAAPAPVSPMGLGYGNFGELSSSGGHVRDPFHTDLPVTMSRGVAPRVKPTSFGAGRAGK